MSSEQDRIKQLAERVAQRLGDEAAGGGKDRAPAPQGADLSDVRASLSEIRKRLAHIETHIRHDEDCEHGEARPEARRRQQQRPPAAAGAPPSRPTMLSGTYVPAVSHPSQEQFAGLGEAVSELVDFFESEKTCTIEPGGKPCDHCGACSSRGF